MRVCYNVCLVAFIFASAHMSLAQAPVGGVFRKTPSPMEWFNQTDRNKDGKLSFNALYQNAEHYFAKRQQEAQPADGRALPDPLPVQPDPLGLQFTQDYFPGTKDPDGLLMAFTAETQ
ncbi:MAG: hypothetical protein MUF25_10210 [Pirellulaceae bacterium]|nr:hypothetical protein [Pirellulaceae bacterium]